MTSTRPATQPTDVDQAPVDRVTRPDRPGRMTRFGQFVVRRRRTVILTWVAALVGTAAVGSSAFDVLSTDFGAGNSTESGRVAHELDDLDGTGGQLAVVADRIDVADPQVQAGLADGLARIEAVDGVVDVATPWNSSPAGAALRATDGRAALFVITFGADLDEDAGLSVAHRVEDLARGLEAPEVLVG